MWVIFLCWWGFWLCGSSFRMCTTCVVALDVLTFVFLPYTSVIDVLDLAF